MLQWRWARHIHVVMVPSGCEGDAHPASSARHLITTSTTLRSIRDVKDKQVLNLDDLPLFLKALLCFSFLHLLFAVTWMTGHARARESNLR